MKKNKRDSNLSIQSQDDNIIIGVFGEDDQKNLLGDDTSVQHQNGNNFELGQSVDMETISRNRDSDSGDIEIGDGIGKLEPSQRKMKKKKQDGTQSLVTLPSVPTNANSMHTMPTLSTNSVVNLRGSLHGAGGVSAVPSDPYTLAVSTNISTRLKDDTPKRPLAYHLRNHNAAKNHRQQKQQYMTNSQVVAEARRSVSSTDFIELPKNERNNAYIKQNQSQERVGIKPKYGRASLKMSYQMP